MIRSTFAAVPKRLPVLWAKAGVLAVVTGVPMLVAVFTAFFTGQAILSGDGTGAALTDPGVLRAVLGSVGFLAGVALLGLAIGAIVRNTAGAIAALVAILLLLPGLLGLVLPSGWGDTVVSYLPSNAAAAFTTVNPGGRPALRRRRPRRLRRLPRRPLRRRSRAARPPRRLSR